MHHIEDDRFMQSVQYRSLRFPAEYTMLIEELAI